MTATDTPTPASRFSRASIAALVALLVVVALVVSALALRYGGPSGTSLAADACTDQASPASTFDVEESFSVDALVERDADDLEGWEAEAKRFESQVDSDDNTETFWVVGTVDDTTEAVCIVDFTDGELITEPQFVEADAIKAFQ